MEENSGLLEAIFGPIDELIGLQQTSESVPEKESSGVKLVAKPVGETFYGFSLDDDEDEEQQQQQSQVRAIKPKPVRMKPKRKTKYF